MPITAIIFDLDGVLIDSSSAHRDSWHQLANEREVEISDQTLASCFGRQNRDIIPILFGDDLSADEVRELGHRKEALYREQVRGNMPVMPGAQALVHYYYQEGYLMAIGSSTPRDNVLLALSEMGVSSQFEVIVSGDDVSLGKPDPLVFMTAARQLGVSPGDCMVIEDAPAGIEAARAAGMPVVALAGSYPIERLRDASRVVHTLEELIPPDGRAHQS